MTIAADTSKFFLTRDEREVFEWVINDFPFPLALTYARLQDELDKQSPIAAAWQLRDTFESLLKFTTCVAVADFLQANPEREDASAIVGLLFKRGGLSLGDWVTLLVGQDDKKIKGSLRSLEAFIRSESPGKSGRLFPELFDLFFKLKGAEGKQFSDLTKRLKGDGGSTDPNKHGFVEWRNRVFGHGTFKSNYGFYAEETNRWLPVLHEFLKALRPVFEGWSLVSVASTGQQSVWQGEKHLPYVESHIHEPEGEPQGMLFKHQATSHSLPFGLLMSLQQCAHCKQPTTFFFDSNSYDRKKDRHKTYFLEYFGGHEETHQNWLETQKLAAKLPPHFDWQRTSYDSQEVQANLALLFRDFDTELVRPDYLVDNFWRIVDGQAKGYVHLIGESGMGKTFFVRALEREGKERGRPVLAYHILAGALSDYRTFISELSDRAKEALRFRTQEAQTSVAAITDLQKQFAEFLAELMRANGLDQLVVAIDALDELPEPEAGAVAITSLLPAPDQLPNGCFVLLTGREALRHRVRQDLEQLEQHDAKTKANGQPERFTKIKIRPEDAENQRLLWGYLQAHLPERFRDRESMAEVLQRSGGVFLYTFHFCRALESGAFANVQTLPEGRDFYPTYLASLREATGELYDRVYVKALLLLAAAQTPVTLDQLAGWGVPKKDLPFDLPIALLGIKDFLRLHRVRLWHDSLSEDEGDNRYDIAHEAFVRYLLEDEPMAERLREAHANIARLALAAHQGRWKELNTEDDAQLYNLRFVLIHLREAGLSAQEREVRNDEEYALHCYAAAYAAQDKAKYFIAADLYDNAISGYRYLVEHGRNELVVGLADVLINKGVAIASLGKWAEAIGIYGEPIAIYRQLVNAGHSFFANDLATVLMNKGLAIANLGELEEAIGIYDEATELYRQLVKAGHSEFANDLATVLMNKGTAKADLGKLEEAVGIYDEVIAIRQPLVNAGRSELADGLAGVLMNKGNAYLHLGKLEEAVGIYDEAISIFHQLVKAGRSELANELAMALMNQGIAIANLGHGEKAIGIYDEATGIYRQLVNAGRSELANDLATALLNKGLAIANLGKLEEAIGMYDEAIAIRRQLVKAGRSELANELAMVLMNKGSAIANLGKLNEAIGFYDEVIAIRRQLINAGRIELARSLALVLTSKGNACYNLDKLQEAVGCFNEALKIYGDLINAGRSDLANELEAVYRSRLITFRELYG